MKIRKSHFLGIFLLGTIGINIPISAAAWTNGGAYMYSNNKVDIGVGGIPGVSNLGTKMGIKVAEGTPWLTMLQPNYNTRYSMHNASDGTKLEFAVTDGTNGQTHWNVLSIIRNGDIQMGSNSDPVMLSVNGTVKTKQVQVTNSSWADYVFEDNYKLKSLDEVSEFINKNKHLPDVPSAREVETNGIDLGDMQKIQMLKIEELTLYVIDLQKQVSDLKSNLNSLNN